MLPILKLYFDFNSNGNLEREEGNVELLVAKNITVEQALNISKVFAKKYEEVWLYDGEYEAYISIKNGSDEPVVHSCYLEDDINVAKKYGLYVEEEDDFDEVDLDNEKWDNYWGDFNQCGISVGY